MSVRSVCLTALFPFLSLVALGSGAGPVPSADPPGEKVLFEENFTDAPAEGWSWLREIPDHWKMDKERKELLIRPVWSEGNLKNLLLRRAPDVKQGAVAVEVHVDHVTSGDYEYSGLIWYFDDQNFVAIRKGPHGEDGNTLSLVRRKAGKGDGPPSAPKSVVDNDPAVDLRLVVAGAKATGWYRASSTDEWQSLGEQEMPGSGAAKVGFRTGNGDGPKPSWARFSKFRILQLDR
jgi:Beta xylosidase C-terminal Concanavalin A-like domain